MSEKDGGPAFPSEGEGHGNPKYHSPGMSLRDYFAASALAGLGSATLANDLAREHAAKCAYAIADALLKARTQGKS